MSNPPFEQRLRGFLSALAGRCSSCLNKGGRCPECFSYGARLLSDELRLYRVVEAYAGKERARHPDMSGIEAEIMAFVRLKRRVRGSNILLGGRGISPREKRAALLHLVATGRLKSERVIQAGKGANYYSLAEEPSTKS